MPAERYFFEKELVVDEKIILPYPESHHLVKVMRTPIGQMVELINGQNQLAQAKVLKIKKEVELEIIEVETKDPPAHKIILCQAIPRFNRLENIVEKGTELGMTDLWLFPGDLSEKKKLTDHQLQRLHTITISALKQCGRLDLPHIQLKPSLTQWDKLPYPAYFGDTNPEAPPFAQIIEKSPEIIICIGPESGFSKNELTQLHKLSAHGISLHSNTLRTDTASLVALSLISQRYTNL